MGLDLEFRTRDLARSAMVSGISVSWGRDSVGGIDSGSAAATEVLGTAAVVGAKSDGGADGTALIDPVGGFFLGFGRDFFMVTSGSVRASPLDVEAAALSAMIVAVVRRSDLGGFVVFCG